MSLVLINHLSKLCRPFVCFVTLVVFYSTNAPLLARRTQTLNQKLQHRISATWQQQELTKVLSRLANTAKVPLWLDRRVDRQQRVTLQLNDVTLEQALEQLGQQQSLGIALLSNVVYLGPAQAAKELPTLRQQARAQLSGLPRNVRKRWLGSEITDWPKLSEPKKLLLSWFSDANLEVVDSEQIPHDLWPEQSLPSTTLIDRVVLLLAGFDLTCEISPDGKSCHVVPIKRPLRLIEKRQTTTTTPLRRPQLDNTRQVFTLRLKNQPLGRVLDQLSMQLSLVIRWEVKDKEKLREKLVSCEVTNGDLDTLLNSLLSSTDLQFQREDKRVIIKSNP